MYEEKQQASKKLTENSIQNSCTKRSDHCIKKNNKKVLKAILRALPTNFSSGTC